MIHSRSLYVLLVLLLLPSANTIAFGQIGGNDLLMIKNDRNDIQNIKILIAYRSKYGQYAEWIQKESNGDLINIETEDKPDLAKYDILIIGGSVRVGNIVVAPFIKDHWNVIKDKKVILFTTSGTPPRHPKIQSIYEQGLPEAIRKEIKYFPLYGRISGENLTLWDTFLLVIGKIMEPDETLKKDMGKDFDGVQRENLLPLLKCIEEVKDTLSHKEK
jgi:menaquinone-dependent protoporphyrinogen IX oxidase